MLLLQNKNERRYFCHFFEVPFNKIISNQTFPSTINKSNNNSTTNNWWQFSEINLHFSCVMEILRIRKRCFIGYVLFVKAGRTCSVNIRQYTDKPILRTIYHALFFPQVISYVFSFCCRIIL